MSLQPKQKFGSIQVFKQLLKTGLSDDNESLVETMLDYWGDSILEFILNESISVSQVCF